MRRFTWLAIALVLLALWAWQQRPQTTQPPSDNPTATSSTFPSLPDRQAAATRWPGLLPPQALDTLQRIERGGPFDHRQDGDTFQNRERLLPQRSRGYYREYTVETPGSRDRGARRIVSGGNPPVEYFYTDDHYRSFRRFVPTSQAGQ